MGDSFSTHKLKSISLVVSTGCSIFVWLRAIIIIVILLLYLLLLCLVVRWHDHVIRLDRYFRVSWLHTLVLVMLVGDGQAQVLLNACLLLLGCL